MTSAAHPTPVDLPVLAWGDASAPHRVLLAHGLGGCANTWWRVADEVAHHGVRVVAPDLRGHGSAPRASTYRIVDHAADLVAIGGGWDVVVAHSLAGPITATAAISSGYANALVLLDPVFDVDDDAIDGIMSEQIAELDLDMDQLLAAHPSWHQEDAYLKVQASRSTSAEVIERCLADSAPWHHLDLLAHDALPPTRILAADPAVGTMFPPHHAASVTGDRVSYDALPGIGHGIHREAPDRVIDEVTARLANSSPPSARQAQHHP